MNKEIYERVEKEREEIKEESIKIRNECKEKHICPNCNKPVTGNRLYCSNECRWIFFCKYDYSQNSKILKDFKNQIMQEYINENPRKERSPWSYPVARKTYECVFCSTPIKPGTRYAKYTRLPGEDEFFEEAPYETITYHPHCIDLIQKLDWDEDQFHHDHIEEFFNGIARMWDLPVGRVKEMARDGIRQDDMAKDGNLWEFIEGEQL